MRTLKDPAGLKVLLVDDEPINLMVLEGVCSSLGMLVTKAESGAEAIACCKRDLPDMILMDVMMPGLSGIETTKQIKQICGDRWVPIVMVTALYSREDIVNGLESGADDYLMKPLDFQILKTKITNITLVIRQQKALHDYRERAEMEREFAIEVMNKLIRPSNLGEKLQYWIKPTAQFCGDVIVAGTTATGGIQAVLADGTGHGLAAALNVIPVVEVFYGMNDKGLPIGVIAREMNSRIRKVMPTGRFVAAALVATDHEAGSISVWNGGIPYAAFISMSGEVLYQWRSNHPALGLLDDAEFDAAAETFRCETPGFLFACSDGLLDAENKAAQALGESQLLSWLKEAQGDRVRYLSERLADYLGDKQAHDDVSFLIAPFAPNAC